MPITELMVMPNQTDTDSKNRIFNSRTFRGHLRRVTKTLSIVGTGNIAIGRIKTQRDSWSFIKKPGI